MIYITVPKMKLLYTNPFFLYIFPSKNSKYVTKIIEIILKNELYIRWY